MDTTQSPPAAAVGTAAVTTHVVTTQLDIVNGGDGLLSLREAIDESNTDGSDSVIMLTPGVEYALELCAGIEDNNNATGDLDHLEGNRLTIISGTGITFEPTGFGIAQITNGCPGERLLHSFSIADLSLRGVFMRDGDSDGGGGAVLSLGSISVEDSIFIDNDAALDGGALGSFLDVTVARSLFSASNAGNSAGAIVAQDIDLTNVMISGSTASLGSAVVAFGDLDMRFTGLGFNETSTLGSADVIVSGNLFSQASFHVLPLGPSLLCAVSGLKNSGGYNFANDFSCGLTTATDTQSLTTDPEILPFIPIPLPGSPLHNAIPAAQCSVAVDLGSISRPQGVGCEIGPWEIVPPQAPAMTGSTDVLTPLVFSPIVVEANDFDPAPPILRLGTPPSKGAASLAGDVVTYTPNGSGDGVDAFTLEVCDSADIDCSSIPVTVTVDGLKSRWFFTNVLQGGAASAEINFGKGAGEQFFVGDFDGNGIDDLAKRTNGSNVFEILNLNGVASAANQTIGYGKPGDEVFVGDFDGNGTDTFAVRRGNQFFVKNSVNPGPADMVIGYGKAGDEVFVGDWDADGDDTFAVRRGNVFYARNSVTTGVADEVFGYGKAADRVLVGDWDANGSDTFAVRRGNVIFVRNDFLTAPAEFSFGFGKATDELFPGDWNNDDLDTFAVRRIIN